MVNNTRITGPESKKFLPGVAWFFFILILICLPGKSIPSTNWLDGLGMDKVAHCILFGILVVLFCFPFKKSSIVKEEKFVWFVKIAIAACVWGLLTELIQKYFVAGRQFDWFDWLADGIGAVLALWFCRKYFL